MSQENVELCAVNERVYVSATAACGPGSPGVDDVRLGR